MYYLNPTPSQARSKTNLVFFKRSIDETTEYETGNKNPTTNRLESIALKSSKFNSVLVVGEAVVVVPITYLTNSFNTKWMWHKVKIFKQNTAGWNSVLLHLDQC